MHRAKIFVMAGWAVVLLSLESQAAQGWKGARIMPKSGQLKLENNGAVTGTVYDIGWPATVERTEGRNFSFAMRVVTDLVQRRDG